MLSPSSPPRRTSDDALPVIFAVDRRRCPRISSRHRSSRRWSAASRPSSPALVITMLIGIFADAGRVRLDAPNAGSRLRFDRRTSALGRHHAASSRCCCAASRPGSSSRSRCSSAWLVGTLIAPSCSASRTSHRSVTRTSSASRPVPLRRPAVRGRGHRLASASRHGRLDDRVHRRHARSSARSSTARPKKTTRGRSARSTRSARRSARSSTASCAARSPRTRPRPR